MSWMSETDRKDRRWLVAILAGLIAGTAALLAFNHPEPGMGEVSPRSPHWPTVRAHYLADHPGCAACGETRGVEVHHVLPFREHPESELDPDNLITLCGRGTKYNHHLHYGHLDDYMKSNPKVREWCEMYRKAHER